MAVSCVDLVIALRRDLSVTPTVEGALSIAPPFWECSPQGVFPNFYYPSEDRGFKLTMSRSGLALGYASAGNLMSEFWPDIKRKVFKKDRKPATVSRY